MRISKKTIVSVSMLLFLMSGVSRAQSTTEETYEKGLIYAVQGKFKEAKDEFEKALRVDPFYIPAKGSLELINDVIKGKVKHDACIHIFKGVVYGNGRQFNQEIAEITEAIIIDPNYAGAYNTRGISYMNKGQHDEAIKDFSKAIEMNPRYTVAYNSLGVAYVLNNQYEYAISYFTKAIEMDTGYAEAYKNRGYVYFVKLRDKNRGCSDWKQACKLGLCDDYNIAKREGDCQDRPEIPSIDIPSGIPPNDSTLAEEFEKLKKVNSIEFSLASLEILAQVNNWEYGMSFRMVKSMGGKSLDLKGKNPFYEDTEDAYRSFLKDLDLAHDKVGLNEELDMYRDLARWRLSELEKTAVERQQRKSDFDKRLQHAKTRADLEKLIQEYEDQRYVVHAKEKLETLFVSDIQKNLHRVKTIIPGVKTVQGKAPVRVTFTGQGIRFGFIMTEYPNDGPIPLIGWGGSQEDVFGSGSVHRYKGEVTLPVGSSDYKIIGDMEDPVSFLLLKERGYVYVHGKGTVITPQGKEIKLGIGEPGIPLKGK